VEEIKVQKEAAKLFREERGIVKPGLQGKLNMGIEKIMLNLLFVTLVSQTTIRSSNIYKSLTQELMELFTMIIKDPRTVKKRGKYLRKHYKFRKKLSHSR